MATIKDVAKKAGVSTATVSRVLNNSLTVSPETRQVVEKAIEDLNYQPNYLGRNLRRSATRMVMILLQNIANPFYSRVVRGIEDIGIKNNYYTMICNTDSDSEREKTYLGLLENRLVDGVILMEPELKKHRLKKLADRFPIVQCCEYIEDADVSFVSIDNTEAAYTAVKHVLDQGHQKIAMISGYNNLLSAIQREKGYKKALAEAGIPIEDSLIKYGSYGFKGGMKAAEKFLKLKERPTAIFAISDIMAIGAINAVWRLGLKVPDDVAIIGFDNTSISAMYNPPITTISQPRYQLGKKAMQLLLQKIRKENIEEKSVFLKHRLIIRQSSNLSK